MEKNGKTVVMYDEEKLHKQRKEAYVDINSLNHEIKIDKRKKIIKISIIVIVLVILFKLIVGILEITNVFGYPPNKVRFYKVTINDNPTSVEYELKSKVSIIPFFVNLNSYYLGGSYVKDDSDGSYFELTNEEKLIIDISSYSCFSKEYQIKCIYNDQYMKENNDTKYTNLKIIRTGNPYEEIYDGKYINDISKYITKKGVYNILITASYSNVETVVNFYIKK